MRGPREIRAVENMQILFQFLALWALSLWALSLTHSLSLPLSLSVYLHIYLYVRILIPYLSRILI